MKPFDKEKARSGHPVCTRDGKDVEIFKFDYPLAGGETIIGLIKYSYGYEVTKWVTKWFDNGSFFSDGEYKYDLFLKSEQREGWVNVYEGKRPGANIYDSKEEALHNADEEVLIDTVPIKWKE
jgi:hypothetical protein